MWNKVKYIILFAAFCCFSLGLYGQDPPEPDSTQKSHDGSSECGSGDGGSGGNIPPPVGLCLPINDYLVPLLVAGILLGAYKLRKIETV